MRFKNRSAQRMRHVLVSTVDDPFLASPPLFLCYCCLLLSVPVLFCVDHVVDLGLYGSLCVLGRVRVCV